MNSGHIIKKMKMEIQSVTTELHDIYGVYGFGSFFRGDLYNDIDILIVASPSCEDTLSLFYLIKNKLQKVVPSLYIDIQPLPRTIGTT